MTTDISEKRLETLIMQHMTGADGLALLAEGLVAEPPAALAAETIEQDSSEPEEAENPSD